MEAEKLLPLYLYKYVAKVIRSQRNSHNKQANRDLSNKILALLHEYGAKDASLSDPLRKLNYILSHSINKTKDGPLLPKTGISQSALFTGDKDEPSLDQEFCREIATSDSIDFLVSFVRFSGLRKILPALKEAASQGVVVRLITTTYIGATEIKAIEEFNDLYNSEIYITYDTTQKRLHAKTYIFHRKSGFSTAYIGSSNLSGSAITSGVEWNIKIAKQELPDTFNKIKTTFESYLHDKDFVRYKKEDYTFLLDAINRERNKKNSSSPNYYIGMTPHLYQKEILEQLTIEREEHQNFRNLVVAATGTGKTVIAAFDYNRLRRHHAIDKPFRLLFIAHREEILQQSLFTFRQVIKDGNFGQILNAKHKPDNFDYLFASVLSVDKHLIAAQVEKDFYDMIIIDEFHHSAAPSYKKILSYFSPKYFLGLTATPERHDEQDILGFFNNRIAAEIRLAQAIEREMLSNFHYFGIADTHINYQNIRWTNGGYDEKQLTFLYTQDKVVAEARAQLVYSSLMTYSSDIDKVKALAFCVTVAHATYMASFLSEKGIESKVISGYTEERERQEARSWLVNGKVGRCICTVDVFNEGIDIPLVNTLLFLRPTQSLTIFIQQLGRGLRKIAGEKDCATVLDFIGNAHKNFRYDNKFSALINTSKESVASQIQSGFSYVPRGCYIHLDPIARKYVLDNIEKGYSSNASITLAIRGWAYQREEKYDIGAFLEYADLTPFQVYKTHKACYQIVDEQTDKDKGLFFYRLSFINSKLLLNYLITYLENIHTIDIFTIIELEKKYLMMLSFTYSPRATEDISIIHNELRDNPKVVTEMKYLLRYLLQHLKQFTYPYHVDVPLEIHGLYSRDQIMIAVGNYKPSTMRQGVYYAKALRKDVFLCTTDKDPSHYSETTNYEDFAISETLFHWQSQSTTSAGSNTGRRYITHEMEGSEILLFARKEKYDENNMTAPYYFLGSASYVSHEGEKPMSIIWRLHKPLSPYLLSIFSH